ncbi:MAG: hypothetical protein ACTHJ4_03405 [Candidatus Nucleicultricaceae bacterium]
MKHKTHFMAYMTSIVFFISTFTTYASRLIVEEQEGSVLVKTIASNKRKKTPIIHEVGEKENLQQSSELYKKQQYTKPNNHVAQPCSISPLFSKLKEEIDTLKQDIEKSYAAASKVDLTQSYNFFKDLSYSEEVWQSLGQQMNVERWSSKDSWKESIGGQLFFPASRLHKWQESHYTEHLLQRSDVLHGCIFAASFKHSLGLFYTTHILWIINRFNDDSGSGVNQSPVYRRMMQKACAQLKRHLDKPDVCYALGKGCSLPTSLTGKYMGEMTAFELHKNGGDSKNQFALLSLKASRNGYTGSPVEEFLDLACQQNYLPAYLEAAHYARKAKQREREKSILEEAIRKGYALAWIDLAYWYQDHKQTEKHLASLNKAAQANIPQAFISLGLNLVGDGSFHLDIEKLENISSADLKKVSDYFRKAGELLHDPRGYKYLTDLN